MENMGRKEILETFETVLGVERTLTLVDNWFKEKDHVLKSMSDDELRLLLSTAMGVCATLTTQSKVIRLFEEKYAKR